MVFVLILIFALFGLFFWNLRQVKTGVKGSLLAGGFIFVTVMSFLLYRQSIVFNYLQMVMIVWLCQALWMYLVWDVFRIVRRVKTKRRLLQPDAERQAGFVLGISFALTVVFLSYGVQHNHEYVLRFETVKLAPPEAQPLENFSRSLEEPAQSPKQPQARLQSQFTALYFSDLHLDKLSKSEKLERMVTEAKSIRPDFILFGGDLADIPDSLMTAAGYQDLMRRLAKTAKVGAVAVDGNHEAYMERDGGDPQGWLRGAGFTVLEDSTACFDRVPEGQDTPVPLVCFTGRTDFQVAGTRDIPRKPLADLAPGVQASPEKAEAFKSVPWIVLDHQPKGIEKGHEGRLPDFALSGHTHDGQFFPATLLIDLFWRLSAGIGNLDGVKWLVSTGIDSWGPPVRVGSDTEMWVLTFEL